MRLPSPGVLIPSIRARVLVAALALLAGTLFVAIIVDRTVLLSRLDERIDRELSEEVEEFRRLASEIDPATGEPFGEDITAIFDTYFSRNVPGDDEILLAIAGGRPYLRSADPPYPIEDLDPLVETWASTRQPAIGTADTPAGAMRWVVVPVRDADDVVIGSFVVARFPDGDRAEVDEAIRVAVGVGAAAFVVAALLAWAIAGRVLAPLRDLADAAASVNEDDLGSRITVEGTGELASLSKTFNDMLDRVDGAFATQRAFLDDASHELRTPITIIRGHIELVESGAPLPDTTKALVIDELDRMARIVEDLLTVAQAERQDFVVPGPIDVADLTLEVAQKATSLGEHEWAAEPTAMIVANLDRQRITQAWMNLVRNAAQHTPRDERIVVFSRLRGQILELGVADSGEGVAAADRARIFERFGRGDSARRTRSDGAGLGLAIVSAVAGAHGGSVELSDTPGGGATFTIAIPHEMDDADADPGDADMDAPDHPLPDVASAARAGQATTPEEPWRAY